MKQFLAVLKFELSSYFRNKTYLLTTILISSVLIIGLSIPSFVDCSSIIPGLGKESGTTQTEEKEEVSEEDKTNYVIYDKSNVIKDKNILSVTFPNSNWKVADNIEEVEELVKNKEAESGFIVNSVTSYKYLVNNTGFSDNNKVMFEGLLSQINRQTSLEAAGINFEQIEAIYNTPIQSDVEVLGKDSVGNYMTTYILLFVIYMMILLYGQLIAVSVTSEKSNRAIEVLVTSTSSNSLIFGKVIAGAIASIIQVGVILGSGVLSYKVNSGAWNGILDNFFAIPSNILMTFALFGLLGYVFYTFIFGTLGALVSKTEDVSKSVAPLTTIFVVVFFICMFGMTNSDSMLIKVASFVPFSSPMAMIVRVAMGSVAIWEIAVSFVILAITTVLTGIAGAKIYRLATLMYGNPIKLKSALKWFKKEKLN